MAVCDPIYPVPPVINTVVGFEIMREKRVLFDMKRANRINKRWIWMFILFLVLLKLYMYTVSVPDIQSDKEQERVERIPDRIDLLIVILSHPLNFEKRK